MVDSQDLISNSPLPISCPLQPLWPLNRTYFGWSSASFSFLPCPVPNCTPHIRARQDAPRPWKLHASALPSPCWHRYMFTHLPSSTPSFFQGPHWSIILSLPPRREALEGTQQLSIGLRVWCRKENCLWPDTCHISLASHGI